MNKNESKYLNTARCMDEALLLLLQKKDYKYITVKEVCKKAGVNRSTFYLHYESMDDLLRESVEMINRRFRDAFVNGGAEFDVKGASKEESFLVTPKYLTPYLAFVKENKNVFRLMKEKGGLFKTEETFEKMYKNVFLPVLKRFGVAAEDQPYVFAYYFSGVLAVIMKWVELDCKKPADEVIALIAGFLPVESEK
ncbi:MAG: TetR/AcrR family transcriptional regulator [Candidatus Borkfalkiaceae bacterium]|nr:TetR/AcrR family transcriptional regulator [Clostridia bacterium]MDY6222534.1 TetR/AcrR family transcriptional regulator [Christensenellaceae bacterium]